MSQVMDSGEITHEQSKITDSTRSLLELYVLLNYDFCCFMSNGCKDGKQIKHTKTSPITTNNSQSKRILEQINKSMLSSKYKFSAVTEFLFVKMSKKVKFNISLNKVCVLYYYFCIYFGLLSITIR